MHMAHRAVNAQIESMSSFNLRDKQSGRHGLRPFATASFSRVRLFWGNSEPPQLRKMFNSLVTRNLTWLDLLENLQVELS